MRDTIVVWKEGSNADRQKRGVQNIRQRVKKNIRFHNPINPRFYSPNHFLSKTCFVREVKWVVNGF